jgi:hypothetical protein
MSGHNAFEISKAPARIERVTFAKSKPKSANDEGAGVKKITVWVDLSKGGLLKKTAALFSDAIDEATAQRIASAQGAGMEVRSKRKLGVTVVRIHAPDGGVLFESAQARVERPKIVFGKEAKSVWLVLVAEMAIAKKAIPILDDYFKADVLVSAAVAQLDLEDEAKAKADDKKKKLEEKAEAKKSKGEQVDWTKRDKKK